MVDTGRGLVAATAALGFTVIYSTTRPDLTIPATRNWLAAAELPPAAAVFSRPNKDGSQSALNIKLRHYWIVERRLHDGHFAAFIDEPDIVTELRAHGYSGRRFERLHGCDPVDLHAALVFRPRTARVRRTQAPVRGPHRAPHPVHRAAGAGFGRSLMAARFRRLAERRDARRFPPPGELVDISGRRPHVFRSGTGGPVVIVLPSLSTPAHEWVCVQRALTGRTDALTH